MGYTKDEISSAVSRLLVTSVRYGIDSITGNQQIDTTFSDIQETAAYTFVANPTASLRVVQLSARVNATALIGYLTTLAQLQTDIATLARTTTLSSSSVQLANAHAALIELENVVQSGKFKGLSAIPSYQRFASNSSAFLAAVKPSVVSGGDVVASKQQIMSAIPGEVSALPTQFADVLAGIKYFVNAMIDYQSLNLPTVLASNVVRRARQVVQARYDAMAGMTLEQQQDSLKDATLEILAARGVLGSLASFDAPVAEPPTSGTIQVYADLTKRLSSAGQVETLVGPFLIRYGVNDQLHLVVDGTAAGTFDIPLPAIDSTYIEGWLPAPYLFDNGQQAYVESTEAGPYTFLVDSYLNLLLESSVGTYQKWDVNIPIGAGVWTLVAIISYINSVLGTQTGGVFLCDAFTAPRIYAASFGSEYRITVLDGTANVALGFESGQTSVGRRRNDQLLCTFQSQAVPVPVAFTVQFVDGVRTIDQVINTFNACIPAELAGLLLVEGHSYTSPGSQQFCRITVLDTSPDATFTVTGTTVPGQPAYCALGMEGTVAHTKLTAQRLADMLNLYEDAGPPVRKFSSHAVALVSGAQLVIQSKLVTSTTSSVEVSGTAAQTLLGVSSKLGLGTGQWQVMTMNNPGILTGDVIDFYAPSSYGRETVLSRTDELLLYTDLATQCGDVYTFTATGPYHAIARRSDRMSFDQLVDDPIMRAFLDTNYTKLFSELNRYANMMLADKNPTVDEINTLQGMLASHVGDVQAVLNLLNLFQAYACKPVDDLFRQLNEKGSDQAVAVLQQCRFAEFFGLDIQNSSYAGSVMAGLQTIARQDLPVVKFDRVKGARNVLVTTQSTDYDTDFSDSKPDDSKYSIDKA